MPQAQNREGILCLESSGKPDAWKLARPVWGWGRGETPRPTPQLLAVNVQSEFDIRTRKLVPFLRSCTMKRLVFGVILVFSTGLSHGEVIMEMVTVGWWRKLNLQSL